MKRLLCATLSLITFALPVATHAATPPALLHWTAPMNGMNSYTYWFDPNGGRYSFLSNAAVSSWFPDASSRVQEVPVAELAVIPLKGTMSHKPAARLVQFASSPRIYAVSRYGMLRLLTTENVTAALYGANWKSGVDELSVADYPVYRFASPVTDEAEFDRDAYLAATPTPTQNIPAAKPPETFEASVLLQTDTTSALVGRTMTLTATVVNPRTSWQNLTLRFYDQAGQVLKTCKGTVGCSHSFDATGPLGVQSYTARVFNEFDQAVASNPVSVYVANPQ
ncbi:hypothetical protein A3E39_00130 [Candidatus Uhrbacteria bacterium RIFCSPHIGHO2_12_FULL_60_25]|uniref:Bacterial Ig-like domain-containing protein n=1 Tax=Candidatus Uhrbacteria bacterium RIFCSPHIGHO2_12_FULL_60_25 TaxID=1802399 RepID=A0A1F7UP28_9BACT|nr:MAG: hypothetical protein A3D73_01420 [Candidatus Uhrbacteria bacterium RIFCSPHIGHO2_02_FULL_60_44]OGL79514.1 MAG: hypothetical protein A3E39_00130 [Candidatus Uhrbacteria bacterium RIFCSPHIGHO2_12_FULL_60_25]